MEEDLLRRAADLAERCERTATVTSTAFLTPAEQYALTNWARHRDCTLVLHGGGAGCERRAAFFLPFYLAAEDFDPAEHLCAVHFSAPFGAPGHRDYLGAILGLGIRREWVGDILVQEHGAYVFCLPSVAPALLELEQVGRTGVKAAAVELAAVPVPERKVRPVTFTVQSARLDAVVSGMFRLSRTSAAAQIRAGAVHLNYAECLRPDAPELVSCPTCGRTEIDLFGLARAVEDALAESTADIKVAVMGCVVNGPGEAREADLGVAGGRDKGIIFRKGEVIRSVKGQDALLAAFMEELQRLLKEKETH